VIASKGGTRRTRPRSAGVEKIRFMTTATSTEFDTLKAIIATHRTHVGTPEERLSLAMNGHGFLSVGTAWGETMYLHIVGGNHKAVLKDALRRVSAKDMEDTLHRESGVGRAAAFRRFAEREAMRDNLIGGRRADAYLP
jgi:hypothetical protein